MNTNTTPLSRYQLAFLELLSAAPKAGVQVFADSAAIYPLCLHIGDVRDVMNWNRVQPPVSRISRDQWYEIENLAADGYITLGSVLAPHPGGSRAYRYPNISERGRATLAAIKLEQKLAAV